MFWKAGRRLLETSAPGTFRFPLEFCLVFACFCYKKQCLPEGAGKSNRMVLQWEFRVAPPPDSVLPAPPASNPCLPNVNFPLETSKSRVAGLKGPPRPDFAFSVKPWPREPFFTFPIGVQSVPGRKVFTTVVFRHPRLCVFYRVLQCFGFQMEVR